MGRAQRKVPARLGAKLRQVRLCLGIESYEDMIRKLDLPDLRLYRASIHEYEENKRTPPLLVLLRYSELSGVTINDLVDDRVNLSLK